MYVLALSQRVGDIIEKDFVTLPEDTSVSVAVKTMHEKDVSCVLVTSKDSSSNDPIGIVTERDMLYRVLARNKEPYLVNLGQIMTSPLLAIDAESSVADAISTMRNKHIRRLAVQKMKGGKIIGIVTLMSVVGNIPSQSIDLVEVELPKHSIIEGTAVFTCPYCKSTFDSRDKLTHHLDENHLLNC